MFHPTNVVSRQESRQPIILRHILEGKNVKAIKKQEKNPLQLKF